MHEVTARPATQIENGIGRITFDSIEKSVVILTDVVILHARSKGLGGALIVGEGIVQHAPHHGLIVETGAFFRFIHGAMLLIFGDSSAKKNRPAWPRGAVPHH